MKRSKKRKFSHHKLLQVQIKMLENRHGINLKQKDMRTTYTIQTYKSKRLDMLFQIISTTVPARAHAKTKANTKQAKRPTTQVNSYTG